MSQGTHEVADRLPGVGIYIVHGQEIFCEIPQHVSMIQTDTENTD